MWTHGFSFLRLQPDLFVLQVLHRQRGDDRSGRLGDVPVRSGDRAGGLVDHSKVDFTVLLLSPFSQANIVNKVF